LQLDLDLVTDAIESCVEPRTTQRLLQKVPCEIVANQPTARRNNVDTYRSIVVENRRKAEHQKNNASWGQQFVQLVNTDDETAAVHNMSPLMWQDVAF